MIIEKTGLLIRVRTVLTVFVMLIGLGNTLMAMKPADKNAAFTYGVAETTGGMHYEILADVTGIPEWQYDCNDAPTACLISSDQPITTTEVLKQNVTLKVRGQFVPAPL